MAQLSVTLSDSKPDFKVMVILLVFMQLTRDLFAIAKFLLVDVCVVSTVCRRLLLQQRPSLNLTVNCLTLICRLLRYNFNS